MSETTKGLLPFNIKTTLNVGDFCAEHAGKPTSVIQRVIQELIEQSLGDPQSALIQKIRLELVNTLYEGIAAYAVDMTDEERLLATPVTAALELSTRSRKRMYRLDPHPTVGLLTKTTAKTLLDGRGFGEASLQEVREQLERIGLKLAGD